MMNLSNYMVKRGLRIPTSIKQLTIDETIICGLLKEIYQLSEDQVEEVEVTVKELGDIRGHLSDSGRVSVRVLTTDREEMMVNWFVKVMPSHQENNQLVAKFNVFKNEIEFYTKIAPKLRKFLAESGDSSVELDIPDMLYSRQEGDKAIIVLEDLVSQGFTQDRDENGARYLSKEKAVLAVETIAKIHATSYALQLKNNVDLTRDHPSLAESGLLWSQEEMTERLLDMKETYCSLLEQCDKPDSGSLLARFRTAFSSSSLLREMCQSRCSVGQSVKCLQQGDFHFNNLMFRQTEKRLEVRLVDWQLTYTGRVGGDISYLIMSSLDPKVREQAEMEIKARYFQQFNKMLDLLDCQPSDQLEDDDETDLKLGFLFSCGNVMTQELTTKYNDNSRRESFAYQLCKEAADKLLI